MGSYFAMALSHEMPSAVIVALDISDAQYPARKTRPSNIEFDVWDIFSDVPEKYIGQFAVVHLRLIVAATHGRDKDIVNRNLLKLLSMS